MIRHDNKRFLFPSLLALLLVCTVGCYPPGDPQEQSSSVKISLLDATATGPIIATTSGETHSAIVSLEQETKSVDLDQGSLVSPQPDGTFQAPPISLQALKGFKADTAYVVFRIYEPGSHQILSIIRVSIELVSGPVS